MNYNYLHIFKLVFVGLIACIGQLSLAQENVFPYFRCLPGDYLNSPTLHQLAEQYDYKFLMYDFLDSDIDFAGNVSIINGKVDHIKIKRMYGKWSESEFPATWGIKTNYKDMAKTDKSLRKPREYDIFERIHVKKEIDSLEINLTYGVSYYEDPDDWQMQWNQKLSEVCITGNAAYSEGCIFCDPPPQVWKTFIGEEGGKLCEWLCDNMGKAMQEGFVEDNFVPVTYYEHFDETPVFGYGQDNYFFTGSTFLPGDYFMSHDGTTVIRLEQGIVRSLIFYPQIIPVDVLPSIDKSYRENDLLSMYPEIEEFYESKEEVHYCTLETSHFSLNLTCRIPID
jgi:hypothetical protein